MLKLSRREWVFEIVVVGRIEIVRFCKEEWTVFDNWLSMKDESCVFIFNNFGEFKFLGIK